MMGIARPLAAALIAAAASAHAADPVVPGGAKVYGQVCIACHQAGGKGMAGLAPALAGTLAPALGREDGRRYVTGVLLHGLSGRIESQGQVFMGAMPPQATLSDAELLDVANHLAQDLNGVAQAPFTAEDIAAARAAKLTHKDLRELRAQVMK